MEKRDWIVATLIVVFLVTGSIYGYIGYKDCIFHHGDYVRGMYGMICINKTGHP